MWPETKESLRLSHAQKLEGNEEPPSPVLKGICTDPGAPPDEQWLKVQVALWEVSIACI